MSYEPLHQKYRPQTFADLVGQSAIADTLSNAIARKRIAPAYLFSGPRGTGKTSSARILAKSLNCASYPDPTPQPCGQCEICRAIRNSSALDIIEIDAASNTGVDNIREIIERSSFAPVQCRYKIYIIDECHMLSTAAFNALLKTLEEPPPRVIFVLATTDPQRVLPTIISRCQRFDFQRIPLAAMTDHLGTIAEKEAIEITQDALSVIAQVAQGGLRDAQSLLDQLSLLSGTITIERVWDLVGAIPEQDLITLLQAIKQQNGNQILNCCRQLMDRGREPIIVLENLAAFYRDLLIAKTAPNQSELVALTGKTWQQLCEIAQNWTVKEILAGQKHLQQSETQIKNTTQPRLWLEVTLLGLLTVEVSNVAVEQPQVISNLTPVQQTVTQSSVKRTSDGETSPNTNHHQTPVKPEKAAAAPEPKTEVKPSPTSHSSPQPTESTTADSDPATSETRVTGNEAHIWSQVLERLSPPSKALFKEHCRLLAIEGNTAQVAIKNQNLLALAKSKRRYDDLEKAFTHFLQRKIKVDLQVNGEADPNLVSKEPEKAIATPATQQPETPPKPLPEKKEEAESPATEKFPIKEPTTDADVSSTPTTDEIDETVSDETVDSKALEKIAQELADTFKGEVINFDQTGFSFLADVNPDLTEETKPNEE